MNLEWLATLWSFLAMVMFVSVSLVGFAGIAALAAWKSYDLYVIIRTYDSSKAEVQR